MPSPGPAAPARLAPAVLLMGPTASGKTGLSMALAAELGGEIVSVDSAQVYRGMDIGTAKPSPAMRAQVRHHLLDIRDPADAYSAAQFRADALAAVADIRQRGRIPLLVGGTMLYFRALQRGLSALPPADPAFRERLEAEARTQGWPALHARLAARDPQTAARLHPNDAQRIQRALEIVEATGRPASRMRTGGGDGLPGPAVKLALNPPARAVLHERIRQRFEAMMAAGFLDEVAALRARGDLDPDLPSMRAVGYRQLRAHLDGAYGLDVAIERGIAATRQLAKRQLTWLRSETGVATLDPDTPRLLQDALEHVRRAAVEGR
jgi:tRNA dimethylallyltransferase